MYPLTIGLAIENRDLREQAQTCLAHLPFRVIVEHQDTSDLSPFLERLERMRPDVVLVDISNRKDPLENVVVPIRKVIGDPMIIALNVAADAEAILAFVARGDSRVPVSTAAGFASQGAGKAIRGAQQAARERRQDQRQVLRIPVREGRMRGHHPDLPRGGRNRAA